VFDNNIDIFHNADNVTLCVYFSVWYKLQTRSHRRRDSSCAVQSVQFSLFHCL